MDIGLFLVGIVSLAGIYAILTLGYNVQFGQTGLVNLGYVAYFAVGAYTSVILTIARPGPRAAYMFGFGLPLWVGFIAAGIAAGIFAYLVGLPSLRLGIEYFVVVTFAVGEVLRYVLLNEAWLTNGLRGFHSLPQPFHESFDPYKYDYVFAALVIAALVATYLVVERICRSPFGRSLKAVRENENVTSSLGKKVSSYKMRSFIVGAVIAGFAGSLYVRFTTLARPEMFGPTITFTALLSMIIGGKGNNKGAVVGAFIFIFALELTRFFQVSATYAVRISSFRALATGVLLILTVRYLPQGILKEAKVKAEELGRGCSGQEM